MRTNRTSSWRIVFGEKCNFDGETKYHHQTPQRPGAGAPRAGPTRRQGPAAVGAGAPGRRRANALGRRRPNAGAPTRRCWSGRGGGRGRRRRRCGRWWRRRGAAACCVVVLLSASADTEGDQPGAQAVPSICAGTPSMINQQKSILRDFIAHYEKAHDAAHLQMFVSCLGPLAD